MKIGQPQQDLPHVLNLPRAAGTSRSVISDATEICREYWQYRHLLYQMTLRDIRIRYKQTVMGFAWAILMPATVVLAGLVIRYIMARLSGEPLGSGMFAVVVKSIPWTFFVGAIGFATGSLLNNKNLVTKIYFPREIFPVSAALTQSFDTTIGAAAIAICLPFFGMKLSMVSLWIPALAVLLFVFTVAAGLLLSCANLFFRDVKYLVQVLLTFGIFFTPVFFEPAMLGPAGAKLIMLNPLAPILEGLRLVVVEHHNLLIPQVTGDAVGGILVWTPWYLAYSAGWALIGLVASSLLFHRMEFLFAEYA
ncbi:MAG: ABC transporter permease [Vicinamibacteria bacterium]